MTQPHVGLSHLNTIKNLINTPYGLGFLSLFVFHHLERKKVIVFTFLSSIIEVCQNQGESLGGRSWVYETFDNIDSILQHLDLRFRNIQT